ncbi:MAG TPA: hypothetical protein VH136_18640 [Trebonia sp.]|jgi:hypothetical protein|nr:hypothetical protein [Trebonia sp.]
MSATVTSTEALAGILPCVVSGGRPSLDERRTARWLSALHGVTADPVWVVRDDEAGAYEDDGHEIAAYPRAWAETWAREHWTDVKPYEEGGFLGAFPGREWAARLAEQRGYWAVLQLDDNIVQFYVSTAYGVAARTMHELGGLGMYADIIAAVALSTNAAMCGANLASVNPGGARMVFARRGFPYSLFLERTGPRRMPWHGPSEDDIIQAIQYGASAAPVTAGLILPLRYQKDNTRYDGGLRRWYDDKRSVGLQRMHPEAARLVVRRARSNGRGDPRVFHAMSPDAIRTPLVVLDRVLFSAARDKTLDVARATAAAVHADLPRRVAEHANKHKAAPNGA